MLPRTVCKLFALISILIHYFYQNNSHFDDTKYIILFFFFFFQNAFHPVLHPLLFSCFNVQPTSVLNRGRFPCAFREKFKKNKLNAKVYIMTLLEYKIPKNTNRRYRVQQIEDITWPLGDMNFIFSCWKYLYEWAKRPCNVLFILYRYWWNYWWNWFYIFFSKKTKF